MLAFLAGSGLAKAATNIDNCTTLNVSDETYLLTDDINTSESTCMLFDSADNMTLDCQGHYIDGTDGGSYGAYVDAPINISTIQNCVFYVWSSDCINMASSTSSFFMNENNIINTTCENLDGPYFSLATVNISEYTSRNNIYGLWIGYGTDLHNFTLTGSKFYNDSSGSLDFASTNYALSSKIYNNLFNDSIYMAFEESPRNVSWNTTRQTGTRIYSAGTEIGGNYWTNSTANGYSDTCTDANTDGFCDDPYDVEAGVACAEVADGLPACGNNTDWLPLSAFYEEPLCVQNWTCTEWGECVRGYQTRECTDENQCGNETGRPAERQLCLTPVPNATMNITQACCPISTLRCYDNSTLMELWNTSAGVAYAFEDCPFGCDNATSSCAPKAFEQNLYLLGIFIFIVVAGLIAIKWAKR